MMETLTMGDLYQLMGAALVVGVVLGVGGMLLFYPKPHYQPYAPPPTQPRDEHGKFVKSDGTQKKKPAKGQSDLALDK